VKILGLCDLPGSISLHETTPLGESANILEAVQVRVQRYDDETIRLPVYQEAERCWILELSLGSIDRHFCSRFRDSACFRRTLPLCTRRVPFELLVIGVYAERSAPSK
jgi:hypothetical protein